MLKPPNNWPIGAIPRLMNVDLAAQYCNVSPNTFLKWVDEGRMPEGKKESGRVFWDRYQIDAAIDQMMGIALPSSDMSDADKLRKAINGRKAKIRHQAA